MAPLISSLRSNLNCALMVGVVIPPALAVFALRQSVLDEGGELKCAAGALNKACQVYLGQPILFLNVLYALVVDIGFWLIYMVQGSTWLIDPHWQIIPVCIAFFYATHPLAVLSARGAAMVGLTLLWAVRLMHNYLRRENWQFGAREDWRYADMRAQFGGCWWLVSLFAVSAAQHPMLMGLTLPLGAALLGTGPEAPLGLADLAAFLCCLGGIAVATVADNQLLAYMQESGEKPLVLDSGLWRYSRHPNHFGEQLWWLGLAVLGGAATHWAGWPFLGVLYNHPLDTFVTLRLIEDRMLKRPERRSAFEAYRARTSLLVPWPPGAGHASEPLL